ncbi:hypothetical protein B0F90DRAFT_830961 [Multifurca ochricompacta]|uniref:Uncharacterized protein n=1 Tax=Multifurca ochricompacta TaxID=376703 RepID=A0AAD4QJK6_9AGAM|nr:hypothetical protein B0F90DRAFT_830961 [Multifurca ochricompacta]
MSTDYCNVCGKMFIFGWSMYSFPCVDIYDRGPQRIISPEESTHCEIIYREKYRHYLVCSSLWPDCTLTVFFTPEIGLIWSFVELSHIPYYIPWPPRIHPISSITRDATAASVDCGRKMTWVAVHFTLGIGPASAHTSLGITKTTCKPHHPHSSSCREGAVERATLAHWGLGREYEGAVLVCRRRAATETTITFFVHKPQTPIALL